MPNAENRPERQASPLSEPAQVASFPATVTDGELSVNTAVRDDGTLGLEAQREEDVLFAATLSPHNQVRFVSVIHPQEQQAKNGAQAEPLDTDVSAHVTKRQDGTAIVRVQRAGAVLFDASISPTNGLRMIFDAATLEYRPFPDVLPEQPQSALPGTPGQLPQPGAAHTAPETAPGKETERQTVKLWGNLSRVFTQTPQRATFLFAEHPAKDAGCEPQYQSFYTTLSDEEKKRYRFVDGTVFHRVLATQDRVALLEAAATTDQSVLTCFPHTWQERDEQGKRKTYTGFVLVNWEPMENYKPKDEKKKGKRGKNGQGYPAGTPPLLQDES